MFKQNTRGLHFQQLEDRVVLSADFGVEMFQCAEMVTAPSENSTEVIACCQTTDIEKIDSAKAIAADSVCQTEPAEAEAVMPLVDLGDPSAGTIGNFGELSEENPTSSMTFAPSKDGMVDVVIASSFGPSDTSMEVTDCNGKAIASATSKELDGFLTLSFNAKEGEIYHLNVSSEPGTEGQFMVTIGAGEKAEASDDHIDVLGQESTVIDLSANQGECQGELESAGDRDTFRFTPTDNGKVTLAISETNKGNSTELTVSIFDNCGTEIARGLTNEKAEISFSVTKGEEYFVAVSAANDQVGSFAMKAELKSEECQPVVEDQHADSIGKHATLLTVNQGSAKVIGSLETNSDADAFRFVAPADGPMIVGLASTSAGSQADAAVSVFGPDGKLVVTGRTNQEVAIEFEAKCGVEYQVLVESPNAMLTEYQLTANLLDVAKRGFGSELENRLDIPNPAVDSAIELGIELDLGLELKLSDLVPKIETDDFFSQMGGSNESLVAVGDLHQGNDGLQRRHRLI